MSEIRYSVVVPVYRSTESVTRLAEKVASVFREKEDASHELIFVNDSPDYEPTVRTLARLARSDNAVKVIELTRNFGQQAATLCGIEAATGDFIITMDDDLQHDPEDIPLLIAAGEHDAVIARLAEKKHSLFKRVTSSIKGYFDHLLLGKPRHLKLSAFRLIRGDIARMMLARMTPYPFIPALLFSVTTDVVNVTVPHYSREEGRSHYTLGKMIGVFSNLLISNSSLLLRLIGYLGLSAAALSSVAIIAILALKLTGGLSIPGYASVMILLLLFGGVTLFALGIIGEYLIRLVATAEQRRAWFVRRIL